MFNIKDDLATSKRRLFIKQQNPVRRFADWFRRYSRFMKISTIFPAFLLAVGLMWGNYVGYNRGFEEAMNGSCVIQIMDSTGNVHELSGKPAKVTVE